MGVCVCVLVFCVFVGVSVRNKKRKIESDSACFGCCYLLLHHLVGSKLCHNMFTFAFNKTVP